MTFGKVQVHQAGKGKQALRRETSWWQGQRAAPGQAGLTDWVAERQGVEDREEERGARCEGPGRPSKRVEASSQQSRAFPLCYLPLPLVLSALGLPFRRLEKREKQRRKGGGAKGKRRKEERKRGIPVPFC